MLEFTMENTLKLLKDNYPNIKWVEDSKVFRTFTEPSKTTITVFKNIWYVSYDNNQLINYKPITVADLINAINNVLEEIRAAELQKDLKQLSEITKEEQNKINLAQDEYHNDIVSDIILNNGWTHSEFPDQVERIELALSDIDKNSTLITTPGKVKFQDIVEYAKENNLTWKMEDIGRSQKLDLIKSLINNN